MSKRKSLAELVAELDDPVPKDVDPEALETGGRESDEESELDNGAAREHYESVGKSKLRKQPQPTLGPQYSGSRVRRKDLDEFDEQDDDPFSRKANSDLDTSDRSDNEDYDDPDTVDLDIQDEDDEEIDSDEAFEDGEEELFRKKGFTFKDSGKSAAALRASTAEDNETQEDSQGDSDESSLDAEFDELQVNGESDSDDESAEQDDMSTDGSDNSDDEVNGQRNADALRAMMSSDQKNVVSELSGAVQSEIAKGVAIKKQYATFDALVGSRVHLQKALIAANSLPLAIDPADGEASLAEAAEAAEKAAIGVLNSLTSLLHTIRSSSYGEDKAKTVLGKRPFSATISTPSEDIIEAMRGPQQSYKVHRRAILTKWANKTQATKLSMRNRLVQRPAEDSLVVTLDGQLLGANQDRLIQKTRLARSCAPLQQAIESTTNKPSAQDQMEEDTIDTRKSQTTSTVEIYDDADFYALVLRELIDHKKSYSGSSNSISTTALAAATTPSNLLRGNKVKRVNVDTKASKGRKMKYSVHEKLQNFMAPTDLGTWERRQAEELFAGLLGRKVARLDEVEEVNIVEDDAEDMEMQGLRLFGGA